MPHKKQSNIALHKETLIWWQWWQRKYIWNRKRKIPRIIILSCYQIFSPLLGSLMKHKTKQINNQTIIGFNYWRSISQKTFHLIAYVMILFGDHCDKQFPRPVLRNEAVDRLHWCFCCKGCWYNKHPFIKFLHWKYA